MKFTTMQVLKMQHIVPMIIISTILLPLSQSLNILFIPLSESSVVKSDMPTAEALAKRGHNVTMFTSGPESMVIRTKLVHQIDLKIDLVQNETDPTNPNGAKVDGGSVMKVSDDGEIEFTFWDFGKDTPWLYFTVMSFELGPIQMLTLTQHRETLRVLGNEPWDLVILDPTYQYFGFVVADLVDTPRVNFISTFFETDLKRAVRLPKSDPFINVAWFDINSFWSRLDSIVLWDFADYFVEFAFDVTYRSILSDYFPNGMDRYRENERANLQISLRSNSFDWPTPQTHDTLLMGGMTCAIPDNETSKIEDEALSKFLRQPNKKGIIVAAFGHYLSWKAAPARILRSFKESFKAFPDYLFVWQYNGPPLDPPIPNVFASPWIPQKQLLAHPKALLFISHMGLKSVQEATCFGLPFLSLPVFLDQHVNTHIVMKKWGAGLFLDRHTLTTESMSKQLGEILGNSKYSEGARRMSRIQQDTFRDPSELAAFWIEYAWKHDAVMKPYFSSNAKNLNFFAFYLLDLLAFGLGIASFVVFATLKTVCTVLKHFK